MYKGIQEFHRRSYFLLPILQGQNLQALCNLTHQAKYFLVLDHDKESMKHEGGLDQVRSKLNKSELDLLRNVDPLSNT